MKLHGSNENLAYCTGHAEIIARVLRYLEPNRNLVRLSYCIIRETGTESQNSCRTIVRSSRKVVQRFSGLQPGIDLLCSAP